MQALRN